MVEARADQLFRECWASRDEWQQQLFEAFAKLPPEKQAKWIQLVFDLSVQASCLSPREQREEKVEKANERYAEVNEAFMAMARSSPPGSRFGSLSGGVSGWELDIRGSALYRAAQHFATDLTHEEVEREVMKFARKAGRLSEWGRRFVAHLLRAAPHECETDKALSDWLLSAWGIRLSQESVRKIQQSR